jgi:hypothetical protein
VKRKHAISGIGILLCSAVLIYFMGNSLERRRYSGDVVEELMYFPSGRILGTASLGYDAIVADFLWLRGIQYYGEHHRSDQKYHLAKHIFSTITDLDPLFVGAYRFGAFVLAQDVGQPVAGTELLRKGIRSNPDRWELPFDLGFMYFVELDEHAKAAHFFKLASRLDDAPEVAKRFSAFAYRKAGRNDVAKELWSEIYRSSSNSVMKVNAEYALKNIHLEEIADTLTAMIKILEDGSGMAPKSLGDLKRAGLVTRIPPDPFGGNYFLDNQTGKVLSTTRVSEEAERLRRDINRLLKRYMDRHGRYPDALSDLVTDGEISKVPEIDGATVDYDPARGRVEFSLAWEERK